MMAVGSRSGSVSRFEKRRRDLLELAQLFKRGQEQSVHLNWRSRPGSKFALAIGAALELGLCGPGDWQRGKEKEAEFWLEESIQNVRIGRRPARRRQTW